MPEHEPPRRSALSTLPDIDIDDERPAPARLPDEHKRFTPSKRQRAYVDCWLDPTGPKTATGIAKHLGIPRRTVGSWMASAGFREWFDAELERETDHLWRPLLLKLAALGMQGSVEHAKLLAQIRGAIRPEGDGRGPGSVTVVVGVPRSGDYAPLPAADPRPALPPGPSSSSEH